MRILQLVDNLEPFHTGGGYYHPVKQSEFLARAGHRVFVVAVNDLRWGARLPGMTWFFRPHVFRRSALRHKANRLLEEFSDRCLLPLIVRRFRPDWIGGVLTFSAIKAHRLSRRFGVPMFNHVYETPPMIRENVGREAFARLMTPEVARVWRRVAEAYRSSSALFPVSHFSGGHCQAWLGGAGRLAGPLYPGMDVAVKPGFAGGAARGRTKRILSVGRLSKSKGVHLLIEAVRRLAEPVELHIVGEGEERGSLQQIAAGMPDVRFHGFVEDDALWRLYDGCDVVAYPTSFEGFGMPPMQGLYFHKPCVASDLPVLREVYGDRLDYFPCGDGDALARALARVLGDDDLRARRGAAGHAYVTEHFRWERSARQMAEHLSHS